MISENKIPINEYLLLEEYESHLFKVLDPSNDNKIEYLKIQAKSVKADYIYCLKSQLNNELLPYIYIFDERGIDENCKRNLSEINKQIWTLGEISLALIVYDFEIKIIDTRKPITKKKQPNILKIITEIDSSLRKDIFEGRLIEEQTENYLDVSPYQKLLDHIEKEILLKKQQIGCSNKLLKRLLVKFILIKYLEEQKDDQGNSVFRETYFDRFLNEETSNTTNSKFCDVLRHGNVVNLLDELNEKFQGGIFNISNDKDLLEIKNANFDLIALALDGDKDLGGQISIWSYYDFNLLPIEFISRLYERFVISESDNRKDTGSFYTPPHLARLLIDELLPLDKIIDFQNFKVLDPSCGSGIFLVLAYKRLITLWMFSNNKTKITGVRDIEAIKKILKDCIYGIDVNSDALSISATSLQIELTSHIRPKEIWDSLRFFDLENEGNLEEIGFFKWKTRKQDIYDIILGNPPFNIGENINKINILNDLEDDYKNEKYCGVNGKSVSYPNKNPALAFLYTSLNKLLDPIKGKLFMIMPSSTLLYMPSSSSFRHTIFEKWNVDKIYDFTPLKKHLWGKTQIATVAVKVDNEKQNKDFIEHIVVRNTISNEKGASRFNINKYDRYLVSNHNAISDNGIWKENLLGATRFQFYKNKYEKFETIRSLLKRNKWISSTGVRSDKSSKNQINLKNNYILNSNKFISDNIELDMLDFNTNDLYKRETAKEVFIAPNVYIRLNIAHSLPISFNEIDFFFSPGVLGIKGNDSKKLLQFVNIFKKNKELYITLIKLTSPKVYVQQAGGFTVDAKDIMNLPINLDINGNPIEFPKMEYIEKSVFEDINLVGDNMFDSSGLINKSIGISNIEMYGFAFCEILNFIYSDEDYSFRLLRRIITPNFIWVSFEHGKGHLDIETSFTNESEELYKKIIEDDLSKNGVLINRVVTFYGEKNEISFIKPNLLKYWTKSIGFRDAENVKVDLLTNGY